MLTTRRQDLLELFLKLQSLALFTKNTLQPKNFDKILKPQGIFKNVVNLC